MKTRVLLVDDEKDFVEQLAERLRIRDYDVVTSTNPGCSTKSKGIQL